MDYCENINLLLKINRVNVYFKILDAFNKFNLFSIDANTVFVPLFVRAIENYI